ncbi:hypothetical protein GCM10025859_53280 [Alicyclobacillus fastidiosus]|nr:hypothetical protein GCM10025859_53280 [Alicyclobacillus fastidiosus]
MVADAEYQTVVTARRQIPIVVDTIPNISGSRRPNLSEIEPEKGVKIVIPIGMERIHKEMIRQ